MILPRPWGLLGVSAIAVALTLGAAIWLVALETNASENERRLEALRVSAEILAQAFSGVEDLSNARQLAAVAASAERNGLSVVVVRAAGQLAYATAGDPLEGADPLAEAQIRQQLRSIAPMAPVRRSIDGRDQLLGIAPLVSAKREVTGCVRVMQPAFSFARDSERLPRLLGIAAAVLAASTFATASLLLIARQRLFDRLVRGARQLSSGDIHTAELDLVDSPEMRPMSVALLRLRRRLARQVSTIDVQRQLLETILNQLREGVLVADDAGRIVLLNDAAAEILRLGDSAAIALSRIAGEPVEEVIPQHAIQMLLLTPTATELDAARSDSAPGEIVEVEAKPIVIEHPNQVINVVAEAAEVRLPGSADSEAPQIGRVVLLADVSEMQRTVQMRTDFVANASHELRTPLSTIRGAVETLLQMNLSDPGEQEVAHRWLQAIERHSERLQQMVADLLDLSRLESPNKRFEPERVPVRQILDEIQFRFEAPLEAKGVAIHSIGVDATTADLWVNPQLLRLALDNLVDNAIKFTDAGGSVTVAVTRDPTAVTFEVRDTGCGIPEDERQRVFERFYQVEASRTGIHRGTGLGLSIVRHALGALRGRVHLESEVGVGTTVAVTIPQPRDIDQRQAARDSASRI